MPASLQQIAEYQERIRLALAELNIPASYATTRRQSIHPEADDLVSIGLDQRGREQRMERPAAAQWQSLRATAASAGVVLEIISAFRSFDYQKQIIARKIAAGQTLDQILRVSTLPGFSEHHSGRAIDIGTPDCPPLTEAFEQTSAYAWLTQHAQEFGFRLSYPRGNPHDVTFEPWHWICSENQSAPELLRG